MSLVDRTTSRTWQPFYGKIRSHHLILTSVDLLFLIKLRLLHAYEASVDSQAQGVLHFLNAVVLENKGFICA
jgi:hypothetical protein